MTRVSEYDLGHRRRISPCTPQGAGQIDGIDTAICKPAEFVLAPDALDLIVMCSAHRDRPSIGRSHPHTALAGLFQVMRIAPDDVASRHTARQLTDRRAVLLAIPFPVCPWIARLRFDPRGPGRPEVAEHVRPVNLTRHLRHRYEWTTPETSQQARPDQAHACRGQPMRASIPVAARTMQGCDMHLVPLPIPT